MASELRVNTSSNRVGLGTITYTDTGPIISGITTGNNFKTGTTNVHSTGVELANINTGGGTATFGGGLTVTGAADLNGALDVDGHTNLDNVSVVGVTTFSDAVRIVKTAGPLLELTTNTGAADATLRLSEGTTGSTTNGGGMYYSGADNKLYITCGTNSTTKKITINRDDGNIGIGTAVPDSLLTLDAASNPTFKIKTAGTIRSALIADTGNSETVLASYESYPLVFSTSTGGGTSEKLRITSTGWQKGHAGYAGVGINTFASWARTGGAIRAEVGYNAVTLDYMYFGTGTTHPLALRSNNTTALVIDTNQRLLVGAETTTYKSNLNSSADTSGQLAQFVGAADDTNKCVGIFAYSGTSNPTARGAKLQLNRARSTDGTTNTAVAVNDLIGSIEFKGNDATSFTASARIDSCVDSGTVGTDRIPGNLKFYTSADNTAVPQERLRIDSLGVLQIKQTTNTNQGIEWYSSGGAKSASIGWGNGNANFEFKNFRQDSQSDGPYGNIDFFTGSTTSPPLVMRMQVTGEVGINTTNPTAKLHVRGGQNNYSAKFDNHVRIDPHTDGSTLVKGAGVTYVSGTGGQADGTWRDIFTNWRYSSGSFVAAIGDTTVKTMISGHFYVTAPNYGVVIWNEITNNNSWNSGIADMQIVTHNTSNYKLQIKHTSYYDTNNNFGYYIMFNFCL